MKASIVIEIPDDCMIVDAIALVKVMNGEGRIAFHEHFGSGLNSMEHLAMTLSASDTVREALNGRARPA